MSANKNKIKSKKKVPLKARSRKESSFVRLQAEMKKLEADNIKLRRKSFAAARVRFEGLKKLSQNSQSETALLAAGVAHEFNNILGAIDGHAEWALGSKKLEDLVEALEVARIACARCSQITWALQGLAQAREEDLELFPVVELLEELVKLTHPQARLLATELLVEMPKKRILIYGSRRRLLEVLVNLLRNAFDAMIAHQIEEPKVEILCQVEKNNVLLSVSDNGPGISPAMQELIFQPFFTSKGVLKAFDNSNSPRVEHSGVKGGSGLGLFLARSIAEEHGGTLDVAPRNSVGATFLIRLPLAASRK